MICIFALQKTNDTKMQERNMSPTPEILDLIEEAYRSYRGQVCSFILFKINNVQDAEDLSQDVFVRLLEHCQILRRETLKNIIFTIAKNLVIDYLRRHYCQHELMEYFMSTYSEYSTSTESNIIANDLAEQEEYRISLLPQQRQKIYRLVRFDDKNVQDIAKSLKISPRTVENHLLLSRKEVREYIKQCM